MTPKEQFEKWQIARHIIWRYELDKLETSTLRNALGAIEGVAREIINADPGRLTRWGRLRNEEVMQEIRRLTYGIREEITRELSDAIGIAGSEASTFHSETLSIRKKATGVNHVAISPAQFKSMFKTTPLGGRTLGGWVKRNFEETVIQSMQTKLNTGLLQGKSYKKLINSIMGDVHDFNRRDAMNITRSYVQSANVIAQQAVMEENKDIVKGWKWSAVLEMGNPQTGNGTCLACASLDGRVFKHGEGPPIPLHVNCRCVPIAELTSYRELGVPVDELEEVARPWTIRPDVPIGEGGRNILDFGQHKGNYATWFETRGDVFKKTVLGPRRYEMYKAGELNLDDVVNPNTGKIYRLDELQKT